MDQRDQHLRAFFGRGTGGAVALLFLAGLAIQEAHAARARHHAGHDPKHCAVCVAGGTVVADTTHTCPTPKIQPHPTRLVMECDAPRTGPAVLSHDARGPPAPFLSN